MSLGKSDGSSLIVSISEALQNGEVHKFGFSLPKDWGNVATETLSEPAQKHLKKILDDGGLDRLLIDHLEITRRLNGVELPNENGPISSLEPFSNSLSFAKEIVSIISSLPAQYRMICRGPAELAERIGRNDVNIKLSDQITLKSGSLIPDDFKFEHDNKLIDEYIRLSDPSSAGVNSIEESGLYFEFRAAGHISQRSDTKLARDFYDAMRAFYGAAMAFDIIGSFDFKKKNIISRNVANTLMESGQQFCYIDRSDDDIVKATNLTTCLEYDNIIAKSKKTLEQSLAPIVRMFSCKESPKLKTAAIWIFRATISARQMDKVLESTIALEVLLGDRETSDRIGLSKLMANRCAYALGKSANERKEIIDFFVEFYKVRSDIVHSGRFRIEEDEQRIVKEGVTLAERMLRHEISLATEV